LGAINAQRGNRALTASARAVLLALPHADDDQDLVLTLPACNDGPPLAPRRLRFDRNKFAYRTVEPFCVDEWRNGLRAKPQAARKVPVDALMAVVGDGLMHTREIVRQLRSKASERSIKAAIAEAVDTGRLMQVSRGQYRSMAVAAKPTGADGATADA
jgi:hypothetical protein